MTSERIDLSDWYLPSVEDANALWRKELLAAVTEVLTIIVNSIEQDGPANGPWFTLELLSAEEVDDTLPALTLRINGNVFAGELQEPIPMWQGDMAAVIRRALDLGNDQTNPGNRLRLQRMANELRDIAAMIEDHENAY